MIIAIPTTSPQDAKTESLVHHLRDDVIPSVTDGTGARALVGGVTAAGIDSANTFSQRLPWVIGGGRAPVVPAPDGGVPLDRRADQGRAS